MAKILIIDDSKTAIAAASHFLAIDRHEIHTLGNFAELPVLLRKVAPDLVLLDLEMPVLSGRIVAGLIKKRGPTAPIMLVYSSQPDAEGERAASEMGAVGFVRKSASGFELRRAVHQALRARTEQRLAAGS